MLWYGRYSNERFWHRRMIGEEDRTVLLTVEYWLKTFKTIGMETLGSTSGIQLSMMMPINANFLWEDFCGGIVEG